ncbi:hypothetical protein AXG93_4281s1010 [Marchantia polymorpha subsp. ruderalis]|uniref:F-box domain-containing protein n=1 Tax=Marchantia polymorpha subsp. ruderalis TaxID=1480154 RepID=A0A176WF84_MARPO|nr:hypothetical protein AXG93_4281s1010 [Marchantia polymorpha subsp. ruderalis]
MELEREEDRPQDLLDSLPVELLIKVLRDQDLPVFTLAECRSVCKKWKEIIDGPELRNKIWNKSVIFYDACIDNTAYFCFRDRWIRRNITFGPKQVVAADGGLLCFNELLSTEYVMYNPVEDKFLTLNVPLEIDGEHTVIHEEVMEDKLGALQIVAYEGCVCLLAMDWTDVELDRRSYDGIFLCHPMVRRMDASLIRRTRNLWVMEDGRAIRIYASGGSDVFFVFEEEGEDLEVAKYWAEIDMIIFLPEPPFRVAHEFRSWGLLPDIIHDPWCAIIPAPGVNAEQEWITQQQRHL